LEDGKVVFVPPVLADCGMVGAQGEEVAEEGERVGDFGDSFDIENVG